MQVGVLELRSPKSSLRRVQLLTARTPDALKETNDACLSLAKGRDLKVSIIAVTIDSEDHVKSLA